MTEEDTSRGHLDLACASADADAVVVRYEGIAVQALKDFCDEVAAGEGASADVRLYHVKPGTKSPLAGVTFQLGKEVSKDVFEAESLWKSGRVARKDVKEKPRSEWTTDEVCEFVVLPAVTAAGVGFFLDTLPSSSVGRLHQGAFVSQARKCRFKDLVGALWAHYTSGGRTPANKFVWMDVFSANQPVLTSKIIPAEMMTNYYRKLTQGLHKAIEKFDDRLIFINSWTDPAPLTRAWCVWEIYGSIRSNKTLALMVSPGQEDVFKTTLLKDPHLITQHIAGIDMSKSQCHSERDRNMIFDAVESLDGGFVTANATVIAQLRTWLQRSATDLVRDTEADDPLLATKAGRLLAIQGQYDGAEKLYRQALNQLEQRLAGSEQSEADLACRAMAQNYFAHMLDDLRRLDEAEKLLNEALATRNMLYGPDHEDVGEVLHNLANISYSRDDFETAVARFTEAFEVRKGSLGMEHPSTGNSLNNTGRALFKLNRLEEALEKYNESLPIMRAAHGENHPTYSNSLHNTAQVLAALGDEKKAIKLFEKAKAIRLVALGKDHFITANTKYELALLLAKQPGKEFEALEMMEEVFSARKAALGESHIDTVESQKQIERIKALRQLSPRTQSTSSLCCWPSSLESSLKHSK